MAAAAQRNHRAPSQPELFPIGIVHREIAFNSDWSVIKNRYFGRCHFPMLADPLILQHQPGKIVARHFAVHECVERLAQRVMQPGGAVSRVRPYRLL